MCAIVDANVAHEVFGNDRTEAGEKFYNWITTGAGRLVAGGKHRKELGRNSSFKEWAAAAVDSGRIRFEKDARVDSREAEFTKQKIHQSNDAHILALAQVSGARLLYSNDGPLTTDFKTKKIIDAPRGKVYSTDSGGGRFENSHKRLLRRKDLCRSNP